jgi:hypothetical protein
LYSRPGGVEPNPEVGHVLNAFFDPRRQIVFLLLHLRPRGKSQIEYQFPFFVVKVDLTGFARQHYRNELEVESRRAN